MKTKTLWCYAVDWNYDTQKFEFHMHKQKFYLNTEDPTDEYYYYDKYLDDGIHKDTVGEVTTGCLDRTYWFFSPKLSKSAVMCVFRDYFDNLINQYRDEQNKRKWAIDTLIYQEFKEEK